MKYTKIFKLMITCLIISIASAQSTNNLIITGKVIKVNDNTVHIDTQSTNSIQIGDKVNLYHKTSFGDEMEVGEWKVSKIEDKTIVATPVEAYIPPMVGMLSKVVTSPNSNRVEVVSQNQHNALPTPYREEKKVVSQNAKPYVEKAKKLAEDYYKDPKKYTKSMSDKLWSEIIDNINKAISLGSAEAYFLLAMVYEDGYANYPADMKKMIAYITKSAEHGYVEAQYMLGEMYADGDEVMKDKDRAISWYEKASEQGHKEAKRALEKLQRQYPDITPQLRGKEPINYGFGTKNDLNDLLDIEK